MKNRLYFLLLCVFFNHLCIAQSKFSTAAVDQLLTSRFNSIAPGCVVLIAKNDHVVYQKAFGVADLASNQPMKQDMLFWIGSLTKQYTAVAILKLMEEGKLSLQDQVKKYIPDYPNGERITIAHLLSNTAGIKNYMEINGPSLGALHNYSPAEGVNYFKNEPLKFEPGSKFDYSNSNYYLLGYLIELVSGKTYEQYLKDELFDKAGLKNTYYIDQSKVFKNLATGYSRVDGKLEKPEQVSVTTFYAAGGLMTNATDLFKWHRSLKEGKIVSKSSLQRAFSPYQLNDKSFAAYGFGWYLKKLEGSPTIEHSGSLEGYQADVVYLPEEDIYVATLFNCYQPTMDWQVLTNDIARIAAGKEKPALVLDEATLKSYCGTYEFNPEYKMIVSFENGKLYIESPNPAVRLPKVQLLASGKQAFYIRESELRFEFEKEANQSFKLVTYNNKGKDAEWKKVEDKKSP